MTMIRNLLVSSAVVAVAVSQNTPQMDMSTAEAVPTTCTAEQMTNIYNDCISKCESTMSKALIDCSDVVTRHTLVKCAAAADSCDVNSSAAMAPSVVKQAQIARLAEVCANGATTFPLADVTLIFASASDVADNVANQEQVDALAASVNGVNGVTGTTASRTPSAGLYSSNGVPSTGVPPMDTIDITQDVTKMYGADTPAFGADTPAVGRGNALYQDRTGGRPTVATDMPTEVIIDDLIVVDDIIVDNTPRMTNGTVNRKYQRGPRSPRSPRTFAPRRNQDVVQKTNVPSSVGPSSVGPSSVGPSSARPSSVPTKNGRGGSTSNDDEDVDDYTWSAPTSSAPVKNSNGQKDDDDSYNGVGSGSKATTAPGYTGTAAGSVAANATKSYAFKSNTTKAAGSSAVRAVAPVLSAVVATALVAFFL